MITDVFSSLDPQVEVVCDKHYPIPNERTAQHQVQPFQMIYRSFCIFFNQIHTNFSSECSVVELVEPKLFETWTVLQIRSDSNHLVGSVQIVRIRNTKPGAELIFF